MVTLLTQFTNRYKKALPPVALVLCAGVGVGVVQLTGMWSEPTTFGVGPHFCVGEDYFARQTIGFGATIDEAAKEVRKHCLYECKRVLCEDGIQK